MGYTGATIMDDDSSKLVYSGHWNYGLWKNNHKILSFTLTNDMPMALCECYVDAIQLLTGWNESTIQSAILTTSGRKDVEYHAKGE